MALLPECDVLAGMEMGGTPLTTVMSQPTGLPTVFVRDRAKEYGTTKGPPMAIRERAAGRPDQSGTTTGSALLASLRQLRAIGARVDTVVCAIDRE
ncbi:hypothetical protein ACGFIK_06610 [Micromonospora sp. NPDC048871]|uniref:hypothetical protein n=1 Tax=Micromonospora sp. NPDC048871 TaxID=3364259 RepID=UPI0037177935